MSDLPVSFTHEQACGLVAEAVNHFVEVSQGVDPKTPVPTCPEWTMADLVRHTGSVHRWCTHMVRERSPERVSFRDVGLQLPDDDRWLTRWVAAGCEPLVETLAAADPDASMWAWGPDQHVRWWSRRMVHETTIHRIDAERQPVHAAVEPIVAADGIDEFLTNLPSAGRFSVGVGELHGAGTIGLSAIDRALGSGAHWLITLEDDGFSAARVEKATAELADVCVTGPPDQVLLLAYGRLRHPSPGLALSGDHQLLDWWLDYSTLS